MNNNSLRLLFTRSVTVMLASVMLLSISSIASAEFKSPFVGQWQATDTDGSQMNLTIAGRPAGPFQITWIDDYISLCNGGPGILRGTGWLAGLDTNRLEGDMRLDCFRSGATLDFHVTWQFHVLTNTLSLKYSFGAVTIWHRPGRPEVAPPQLNLRVNYGDDWVESFYEAGHTAWVSVTESDGSTLKASSELTTGPKDYWGGEAGFTSLDSVWRDPEGNIIDPPDIQPNEWVFGWMDNGATAQVQIGEISGEIDLEADSIAGTISALWFTTPVTVECLDWGSGREPPYPNQDGGAVLANGSDPYRCSWADWDIQAGQSVGVGYFGPDGNWVARGFVVKNPQFVAYLPSAIEGYDWPMGTTVTVSINGMYTAQAASEQRPGFPEGETRVLFELWRDNASFKAGDHIVMTDGTTEKDTWVTDLAVTGFDLGARTVSGISDPAYSLEVWLYGGNPQEPAAQGNTWTAAFAELPPGAWGGATQHDPDGDGTSLDFRVPDPRINAWLEWKTIDGIEFQRNGHVTLTIGSLSYESDVQPAPWNPDDVTQTYVHFDIGANGHSLSPGDRIVMTDGATTKELVVPALQVTGYDLGPGKISGTYDPGLAFGIVMGELDTSNVAFDGSAWVATIPGLGPNMWGDAIQTDNDGDDVRATIHTPNPNLYALTDDNKIFAQEWAAGSQLDLKIYGPEGEVLYSDSKVVERPSEVPWTLVVFDLRAATPPFDLLPGQRIVLDQNGHVRELVVSSLKITGFDYALQQIIGTGDAGARILVRIDGEDIPGEVNQFGNWAITHPGLASGVWGEAIQPDADGDETRDGFQAP